jgi:hypothetical protein
MTVGALPLLSHLPKLSAGYFHLVQHATDFQEFFILLAGHLVTMLIRNAQTIKQPVHGQTS